MKITNNYEKQTYKGLEISLINTDWGWFVEVSDGYESEYFKHKKQAKSEISKIKHEIKKGYW